MGGRSGSGLRNSSDKFSPEKYKHINPHFNPEASNLDKAGFNNNCVKCAIAFEANMRGADTEATAFKFGDSQELDRSKQFYKAFGVNRGDVYDVGNNKRERVIAEIKAMMSEDFGKGSRAVIQIESATTRHTMNIVNDNGKIIVVDAQNGTQGTVENMLKGLPTKSVSLVRTDDKKIASDYSSWAYKKRR